MHQSKLIRILKGLTESEIRRFHKFVRSPYFSYNKDYLALFEYTRKYYPAFTSRKLEKEHVFYHLYPDRSFNAQKIRHLMAGLVTLLEDFLVTEEVANQPLLKKKILREAYGHRQNYEQFSKLSGEISQYLNDWQHRSAIYHLECLQNQATHFFHPATPKHLVNEDHLESISTHLEQYYQLTKMQLAAEMKARASILSKQYAHDSLEDEHETATSVGQETLEYQLYRSAYRLYQYNDKQQYEELKHLFHQHLDLLSTQDQHYLFQHLLNFTIRQGNTGKGEYLQESFQLYQLALSIGIIASGGRIMEVNFTNICAVGIKVGEFDWVAAFIHQYGDQLDLENRNNAKILCWAFLHYAKGDYEKTDQLISTFQFTSPFYLARGKILSLRSLFELFVRDNTYYDLLISTALAFEKFLRRNKVLSSVQKKVYLGFTRHLRSLVKCYENRQLDFQKAQRLKEKVLLETHVANKEWLLQKIDALKK